MPLRGTQKCRSGPVQIKGDAQVKNRRILAAVLGLAGAAGALITYVTYRNAVRDAAIDGWFWVSFDIDYAVPALAVLSGLLLAGAVVLAARPSRMWWLGWMLVMLGIAAGVWAWRADPGRSAALAAATLLYLVGVAWLAWGPRAVSAGAVN